ncbi:cyclase family protein [Demequina sp. NBRC 110056]|uniref:cyclase family protein n=1 Tax=Demequina sp. NBRC 110056 TaxID=1570345 RepID=UPI0009FEA394|nr:cyclase family protein [Demequina sp. NBRC 110056]
MTTRIVDLSHPIADGTVTTPGQPAARIGWWRTHEDTEELYAEGTSFAFSHLDIIGGTGTYLDAPLHRYADGADALGIDLARLTAVPGVVVDVPDALDSRASDARAVDADAFAGLELAGRAVLVRTGWSERFGRPDYVGGHPHLTSGAAELLAASGCALVGIDSPNIDSTEGDDRPVHSTLLAAGVPIIEHLTNLAALPAAGFALTALPLPFVGLATSPVRVVAQVE